MLVAVQALATTLLSQADAMARFFPGARVERRAIFLTDAQRQAIEARAGTPLDNALVYAYDALDGTQRVGTAYMDAHRVRTLPETLLLAVDPDGTIRGVEVLVFREPSEYLPGRRWYEQLQGRRLSADMQLKREIHGVTGATLTARATVNAVRRMLAIHAVLAEGGGAESTK